METERKNTAYIFIKANSRSIVFGRFYYKDIGPEEGENSYFIITRNDRRLSFHRDCIYMPHLIFGNDYNQGPVKPFHDILESGLRAQGLKIRAIEDAIKN